MYRDPKQWAYVRRLVLEKGGSRKGVSRKTVSAGIPFAKCLRARSRLVSLPRRMARRKNSSNQLDPWLPSATLSSQSHIDAAHCICGGARVTTS